MPFIAPLITAVVGVVGAVGSFVAALGPVGTALIGVGLNVAVGLIQKSLAKKKGSSAQDTQPSGVQFERQYGADVSRQVACGLVGIAGHDCYVNTYGGSNKELQQVFAISDYPVDGLSRVAINGAWQSLGAVDPSKGAVVTTGEFAGLIWVKLIDGTQTAVNDFLDGNSYPPERWNGNHIGLGVAYIIVSMLYDAERNASFPDFFFEVRGARLYDWRKDDTAGGAGPHRWGNYATHEYSENPIVIEYNYRRGFAINGDLFCGMDMPPGDLPLDKWTAAANICDEWIPTAGEVRYACSIMLDCEATHGENIESIALSCGAMNIDGVSGSWPLVGHDQPVVITFTDKDLISTEPVTYRAKRSMSELVNSISGNFPNPGDLWSMIGYEPQISTTFLTIDRRTRDLNIDFPQVRSQRQGASLARIYLYENRYEATARVVLRPRFQTLEPGDWVRWNSARYGNKVYIVTDTNLVSLNADSPRNIQISLQERDGSIYDGISVPDIILPYPPGMPQYLPEVQSFALIAVSVQGADGRLLPAIRASWETITDPTVVGVLVQYYPTLQPTSVIYKTIPVTQSVAVLVEGVISATEYTVRTKLITSPERVTAWSAGETVTTDYIPDADVDVYLANLRDDAYKSLQLLRSDLDAALAKLDMVARNTLEGLGSQISSTSVAKRFQGAIASAMTELEASVTEVEGVLSAQAAIVSALNATVGDISGSGLWRMDVVAGTGDVVARARLLMRATIGSAFAEVGTIWEAGFTGGNPALPFSRETHYANKFVVVNPLDNSQLALFAIDGGTGQVVIANALIKHLTAAQIEVGSLDALSINAGLIRAGRFLAMNNKTDFDLNAGTLIIWS